MNTIDIKGTAYPVRFGMNFIREINGRMSVEVEGWGNKEEKVGLRYYIAHLMDGDLEALQQIIFVANKTETPKLNISIINDWFEDEETDIDAVFDMVMDFLSKANCTKKTMEQVQDAVKQQESK